MIAIQLDRFGPPTELRVRDIPSPLAHQDDVLVEIHAAVNPSDIKNVQGLMSQTTLPRIPGRDFAGIVREGPDDLVGKEVWGTGGEIGFLRDGTHAEMILLPRDAVRLKPAALSIEEAGAVGVAYVAAWLGLIEAANVRADEKVVIIGGLGAVGWAATQIALWRGAHVLSVIRREPPDIQALRQSGLTFLNVGYDDLRTAVLKETKQAGADVILDTVGGRFFEPGLQSLRDRGRLIEISSSGDHRVSFNLLDFYRRELRLFGVNTLRVDARTSARILDELHPGFVSGALRPLIDEIYPPEEAALAYERVMQGQTNGRVLISPKKQARTSLLKK